MMFELKPDFDEVFARYEAWWHCSVIDRPVASITFDKPQENRRPLPVSTHGSHRDRWMDAEFAADYADAGLWNRIHFADSLPVAYPNLGPEVFSAFYGCEMEFGEHTSWSKPVLKDWSPEAVDPLVLDKDSIYFRKLKELSDAFLERARGRFILGYTDLHGGGDAIAAFRDPLNLLIDTLEHPQAIKDLCYRITTDFLEIYDYYHDILSAEGMPSTSWLAMTGTGKVHIPSNDFSCMISDATFEDLFVPGIIRECRQMDRCIYHLDGPQALRYLDRLLEIPEIHAIQWVPGAGQDDWKEWVHVYQQIQGANKALEILSIPANELSLLPEVLSPEGVWIGEVTGISDQQGADAALAEISKWTRKQ